MLGHLGGSRGWATDSWLQVMVSWFREFEPHVGSRLAAWASLSALPPPKTIKMMGVGLRICNTWKCKPIHREFLGTQSLVYLCYSLFWCMDEVSPVLVPKAVNIIVNLCSRHSNPSRIGPQPAFPLSPPTLLQHMSTTNSWHAHHLMGAPWSMTLILLLNSHPVT